MTRRRLDLRKLWLLLVLPVSIALPGAAAQDGGPNTADSLDAEYQQLAARFHQAPRGGDEIIDDPVQLLQRVELTAELRHPQAAVRLLLDNLDTLMKRARPATVAALANFLLAQNETRLVERLEQDFDDAGDAAAVANIRYSRARYHARLQQWQQVHELVSDTFADLSSDDSDYAYLLQGSALQKLKRHRISIASYANIPADSRYYVHAQLNTAIANIRQGWVTDARLTIRDLLPVAADGAPELTDRIYLVLGYALLHKEYFRDARDAFRQIKRDSRYAGKALLGIALTAISQGDYVGGLNALTILQSQPVADLTADEAYLILPHVYKRLDQPDSVAAAFLEAIDHYQQRLLALNRIKADGIDPEGLALSPNSGDVRLGGETFAFSQHYPFHLVKNRQNLAFIADRAATPQLEDDASELIAKYDAALREAVSDLIEIRKKSFTSYLNQSRYGLARHYDEQAAE